MAKKITARETISTKIRKLVYSRDGYICAYCEEFNRRKPSSLAVDHIIPLAYGGSHALENFVTACRSCNRKKWLYAPKEKGAPKLLWHAGKKVAKVTWLAKGKNFPKRAPKISYVKNYPKNYA